ncbi:metastasis-suppressor KiSS-1 [Tamandua tetradactyla]|uniref:metastasis-suppressor KiSS-1 n=1 Tax=Tamandua tetradactyla TaxID=48850 RepID=UPI0040541789
MNSLVSWQLLLFLCATSFGETFEKVAAAENPRPTGQRLGPQSLPAAWEPRPRCEERRPAPARPSPRGASLCPPLESAAAPQRPGQCASRSRPIPAPRAVLVPRGKDAPTYNWNSFGLRYGKRQAAPGGAAWEGTSNAGGRV